MTEHNLPWRLVPNKLNHYPGGREIDRFRGIEPALDDDHPEAWIGSTTLYQWWIDPARPREGYAECIRPGGERCFLIDAIRENPQDMTGGTDTLEVLAKLLDAKEELGFQCHPSREVAERLFDSPFGKTEAWIVLGSRCDIEEPPYVLLGFKEGTTRESFEKLFWRQDYESIRGTLHKIPVHPGDVFYVGPGVPHAIGAGCFIAEVQEPSDITVVAWLADRGTEEEKALSNSRTLESFEYGGKSYEDNLSSYKVESSVVRKGAWGREELLIGNPHTSYFSCTCLTASGAAPWRKTGRAVVCLVLEGGGELVCGDTRLELKKADELFVPANVLDSVIVPNQNGLKMLLFHPEGAIHTI